MKVDYKVIIESYERANQEILAECYEIATEAEQATNIANASATAAKQSGNNSTLNQVQGRTDQTVDTTSQSNQLEPGSKQKQNLVQRIHQLINKIAELIRQASMKIMNRLKMFMESNKSFMIALSKKRGTVKPLKNFKAITYQYNDQYLETTMRGIQNLALNSINALANPKMSISDPKVKYIVETDTGNITSNFFSYFSKDKTREGGHDIQSFTRELIDTYRGDKKENMWNESKIPYLTSIAKNTDTTELSDYKTKIINQCQNTLNNMKRMESKARLANTSEELNTITKSITKATTIYNCLLGVIRIYYELKIESGLSARMLLKKFYQF